MANGDNACSPVLTVHLPPINATSDEAENVSATFLPKIHHTIETILLKLKSSPSIPVHTLLGNGFDIDELLQVRNVIFECAKEKYCNETNDDAETTDETRTMPNTLSTCDLKLKSRRSTQTAADDIKELCLFLFGHRNSFPKSCLSSTSQHKSKQSQQAPPVTVTTLAEPAPEATTLSIILDAISRVQTDIKLLDNKLSEHISSLSCQTSVSSLSNKETIDALTKECDSLRSTIDMLMTPPSREVELCLKSSPCASSRNGRRASPGQANSPNQTVPTTNRFAVLASHDPVVIDSDITVNCETDAELHSISEVLKPCDHNGKHESDTPLNHPTSYQMQINQYRNKHKKLSTTKSTPSVSVKKQPSPTHRHTHNQLNQANPAADILVIGDSMIKHLQPGRLSRKRKVICRTMRGAKIEDVAQRAKETASKHSVSEVIVHVGTNNTSDDPETIAAKITSLCDTLQPIPVTISSIIHRKYQSLSERKKVDDSNELLKSITARKHWGFIDNRNINTDHLMTDGVHVNSVGVRLLAKNIITHIAGPSECSHRSTSSNDITLQRTPFGEILFSEALKKPVVVARDISTGFRVSNQYYPSPQPIRHQPRRAAIRRTPHRDDEWSRYLETVRTLLNPLCVRLT